MNTLRRCLDMLERYRIPYLHTKHANAYRAREVAAAEHLPPYMLAKSVLVRGPRSYALAVVPANCRVDLEQLATKLNIDPLRLATEEEVRQVFPESELGAMPPFGRFAGIRVYMDARLAEEPYILFNAGTHRDAIHMSVADYIRLADPTITQFAESEDVPELVAHATSRE